MNVRWHANRRVMSAAKKMNSASESQYLFNVFINNGEYFMGLG